MAQYTCNKSDGAGSAGLMVHVLGDCMVCLSDKPGRSGVLMCNFCLQTVWKGTPITKATRQCHQAARNPGTVSEQKHSLSVWKILFGERKHCQRNQGTWMTYVCSTENRILLLALVTEMVVTTSTAGGGGSN